MMTYQLDFEKINKFVGGKKYTFNRRSVTHLLPFPTRKPDRATFERGYASITAGVLRKMNDKYVDITIDESNVDDILSNGKFNDEESKQLFSFYLKEQFKAFQEGKFTTLQQLERVPLTENKDEKKGEMDLVNFFYDTFIRDNKEKIKAILEGFDEKDLIAEILDLASSDKSSPNASIAYYKSFFPSLKEQFLKDLQNLTKNSSFLIEHISLFFVHYTFVAISQMILQTNKVTNFNPNKLHSVFYLLQWENGGNWRDSYKQGNKMLVAELDRFFAHEHALNIIGLNTFSKERNLFYHEIEQVLQEKGPEAKREFIQSIYQWLTEVYQTKTNFDVVPYSEDKTLEDAFEDLISAVKQGVSNEINTRYHKAYESFVSKFFRKHGGSLGNMLALSQELLLLLVAVSITEERIELKQLWQELEKRGVWLDYHSKEEVVKVLDKLNYMEKKSDSGDAQYVKSIL